MGGLFKSPNMRLISYYFAALIAIGLGLFLWINIKEGDLIAYQKTKNCKDFSVCKVAVEASIVDVYKKYESIPPTNPDFSPRHENNGYPRYFVKMIFLERTQNVEVFSIPRIGKADVEIWKNRPTYIYSSGKTIYHPEVAVLKARNNLYIFIFAAIVISFLGWVFFFLLG